MTANGYTRQSAAQIVDGQVINASDSNNEYNALLGAFNGTTGHDHSGGTGLGQKINLTGASIGVTGVLDPSVGGIYVTTTDPTAANASPTYVKGCVWLNTTSGAVFICVVDTAAAAVWYRLPASTITGATTVPGTANDVTQGYKIGSIIYNSTQGCFYLCTSNTASAATWTALATGRVFVSASAPGVNDDNTKGYQPGSVGVETTTPNTYICVSTGTGAAVWQNVTFNVGFASIAAQVFG